MIDFYTADLFDAHSKSVAVLQPGFRDFGGRQKFCGAIATVKVFEDNVLVRQMLEQPGDGRVLVVDGGGSLHCALLGDQLALLAANNQWSGVLVNGCIRDAALMASIDLGVKALATNPRKSAKLGEGLVQIPVQFGTVWFTPGEYLYADEDGVVTAANQLGE